MSIDNLLILGSDDWDKHQTDLMDLEAFAPPTCRTNLINKRYYYRSKSLISLAYERDGHIVGECYGTSVQEARNKGTRGLADYERRNDPAAFYLFSTIVSSQFQGEGIGSLLRSRLIEELSSKGYRFLVAHSREGISLRIHQKNGAKVIKEFKNWYGSHENYFLIEIDLEEAKRALKGENPLGKELRAA